MQNRCQYRRERGVDSLNVSSLEPRGLERKEKGRGGGEGKVDEDMHEKNEKHTCSSLTVKTTVHIAAEPAAKPAVLSGLVAAFYCSFFSFFECLASAACLASSAWNFPTFSSRAFSAMCALMASDIFDCVSSKRLY